MTGLAGLELTSATGAKFWLMPMARSSRPLIVATAFASSTLRPAPTAMLAGNSVAGDSRRVTLPPSWSMATISGRRVFDLVAARCSPLENAATWAGLSTLSVPLLLK
jgi:hypothetical protein